jgi:hypothetical protein
MYMYNTQRKHLKFIFSNCRAERIDVGIEHYENSRGGRGLTRGRTTLQMMAVVSFCETSHTEE